MLLPAFIVSLAKHSPVQLGEKTFTKGRTFCVVEWKMSGNQTIKT